MRPIPIRHKIVLITAVLWILAVWGYFAEFDPLYEGAYIRSAIEMTILWLAWPDLCRLPRWFYAAIPIVIAVGAFRPRILIIFIPLLLLYGFIRPKPKKGERKK